MMCLSLGDPDPARHRREMIAYAEAGNVHAQRLLGHWFRTGAGMFELHYVKALRWYRAAADQGDASAQNDLGSMYLNGSALRRMPPRQCAGIAPPRSRDWRACARRETRRSSSPSECAAHPCVRLPL